MRNQTHDAAVRFRVNAALLASAEKSARKQGMSLSEYLRAAVRDKLRDAA